MYGKDYLETPLDGFRWFGGPTTKTKPTGIGDITSDKRGTGARYNTGKMRVDLIPIWIISAYEDQQFEGELTSELDEALAVLRQLGHWQAGNGSAAEVLERMDDPWVGAAAVFEYGEKKYSKRGDCTCSAGDAVRLKLSGSIYTNTKRPESERPCEDSVSGVTTSFSRREIPGIENAKPQTTGNGLRTPPIASGPDNLSVSERPSENWTPHTNRNESSPGSKDNTASPRRNTTSLFPPGARSAAATTDYTSTTATSRVTSEQRYAIPATLALDLSRGITAGLSEHSHTCGVHETPGMTGKWNWAKGMPWSVPAACAVRHLLAILRGESHDKESGLPHIGHVACNLIMLAHYDKYYPEGDDRPDVFPDVFTTEPAEGAPSP